MHPKDVYEYLNQEDSWITAPGTVIPIKDMSDLWRKNSARWLLRHASMLYAEYRRLENELGIEVELSEVLEDISKPDEWIMQRPLYSALADGIRDPRDAGYWSNYRRMRPTA